VFKGQIVGAVAFLEQCFGFPKISYFVHVLLLSFELTVFFFSLFTVIDLAVCNDISIVSNCSFGLCQNYNVLEVGFCFPLQVNERRGKITEILSVGSPG
jgi:hypothetical protein